jgi:hypothetical protein
MVWYQKNGHFLMVNIVQLVIVLIKILWTAIIVYFGLEADAFYRVQDEFDDCVMDITTDMNEIFILNETLVE